MSRPPDTIDAVLRIKASEYNAFGMISAPRHASRANLVMNYESRLVGAVFFMMTYVRGLRILCSSVHACSEACEDFGSCWVCVCFHLGSHALFFAVFLHGCLRMFAFAFKLCIGAGMLRSDLCIKGWEYLDFLLAARGLRTLSFSI